MQHPQQAAAAAQLVRRLQPNDKVIAVFLAQYALQPQDNADASPQKLVAGFASHITNERRCTYLCCMLDPWKDQAQQVPLFLSISTDGPWQQRVQDLEGTYPMFFFFRSQNI